jgi:hypothetical protein
MPLSLSRAPKPDPNALPVAPGPGSSLGPDAFGFQYDAGREA